MVLSQEIGMDTPHCSSPCPSSHSTKYDEHWFYTHNSLKKALPQYVLADCVKTCNTASTLPLSVELRGLLSVSCPHFALFHQPQPYHATVQLLHMVVAFQTLLQRLCTSFTFFFSRSIQESNYIAQMLIAVLPFYFMLASAI
jgi:hypothetical protein